MNNKTALVTGSSKGIGRAIAYGLADKGYDVIINSRTMKKDNKGVGIDDIKEYFEQRNVNAYFVAADVSTEKGRKILLDKIDEIGRLDILVNNCGVEPAGMDVLEATQDDLMYVMGINFFGPFHLTQEIAKRMLTYKSEGVIEQARIAFVTSIQADRVSRGVGYCFSKVCLRNAVQQLAVRLGEADIPVLEFTPGLFLTDMSSKTDGGDHCTKLLEDGWSLNRRWGKLEEIGRLVASMADGIFDYSTGAAIPVSGGMQVHTLHHPAL